MYFDKPITIKKNVAIAIRILKKIMTNTMVIIFPSQQDYNH